MSAADAACTVIYEVDLDIDAGIADSYRAWLDVHVREMLALPGFTGAHVFELLEPAPEVGRVGLCVQYRLRDMQALDDYLRDHAPRMRAAGVAGFGERFRATRRVLQAAD